MSQSPQDSRPQDNEEIAESTSSGESLDNVLSSIRDAVTAHAEGGVSGRSSPLALAFDDLRQEIARLHQNLNEKTSEAVLGQKELEELIAKIVQPMLASMLKTWLDTNLPPLAERLIREEIAKLSRERR